MPKRATDWLKEAEHALADQPFPAFDRRHMEAAFDKISGLESDLESAVRMAFDHGAFEWVRDNYPALFDRITEEEADDELHVRNW